MSVLGKIVEQEAEKLLKASNEDEPLVTSQLEALEMLSRCAKLLRVSDKPRQADEDELDDDDLEELRRRAGS